MFDVRTTHPTPYEEINTLLLLLCTNIQNILGERLIGFYLYGSLSLGDFDPSSSDIDFLAVTEGDVTEVELEQLREMHTEIAGCGLAYADHLEGSYITRKGLRRHDPEHAYFPSIGVDWPFRIGFHGHSWVLERSIVREHGVVLYGPDPQMLIDPVPAEAIRAAVCNHLRTHWHSVVDSKPDWLRPRNYQAYAILTMCRALYTLTQSVLCSKPQAALWAQEAYPAWKPMIERALLWRSQHEEDDSTETLAFLQEALKLAEDLCQ